MRLLEKRTLDLSAAVAQARALEIASKNSVSYDSLNDSCFIAASQDTVAGFSSELSLSSNDMNNICSAVDRKKNIYFVKTFFIPERNIQRKMLHVIIVRKKVRT